MSFIYRPSFITYPSMCSGNGVITDSITDMGVPAGGIVTLIHLEDKMPIDTSIGSTYSFIGLNTQKKYLVLIELRDKSKHPITYYVQPEP